MQTFAECILNEPDFYNKVKLVNILSKKIPIFFNKSVVFKAIVCKLFIENMKIDVDENLMLTAALLYSCRKSEDALSLEKIKTYAKDSAKLLSKLGFSDRFCKICLEHNRYNENIHREKESDILELIDQFGGMMVDREERRGFPIDEAIILLEHRNMKDINNIYLESFVKFINNEMESIV